MDYPMIEIVKYKESWIEEFTQIAGALRNGLGEFALRIDHIGSTSVPGLSAKDVIDIQITVPALSQPILYAMQSMGYVNLEAIASDHIPVCALPDENQWKKWFFLQPEGQRRTNTHIRIAGRKNQEYALLFRDFLREHKEAAGVYAEVKKRLADIAQDISIYTEVKDPIVDLIYFAAIDWADQIKWTPGKTDA
jgi:GrpB-like predicted nucleotidyltransferase (UPF0157 family)